jgi:serine/threonine protein phosphatase 1
MASPEVRPGSIPDDFTVWAGSDLHGQLGAVEELLRQAGLADEAGNWSALPRTALVVCGDIVDRGPDSVGLVRRLARLREQAGRADGIVVLLEGNHEAQVLGGLDDQPMVWRAFIEFGGGATLASAGLAPSEWGPGASPRDVARRVEALAPDLVPSLWTFAPYARWRDVLFVHGGPVPGVQSLLAFERGAARLWIRDGFFASADPFPDGPSWATYREAGIRRVVFGHTPVTEPTLYQDGRALNVDTWRGGRVTLARLEPGRTLGEAGFLSAPAEPRAVADAPVSRELIGELDRTLPGIIDAWLDARWPSSRSDVHTSRSAR